ncbi:MAG TPA: hypothetical protein V6D16_03575 [Candidatus Obscuribacterales bacterium]
MSSPNLTPSSPIRPLSIGNIVSAGFQLYRSHFKQYLGLACKAILWAFIPVYGWAKASTINATISRLAFQDLVNQPESTSTARNQLEPKLWQFLVVQLLVGLILFGVNVGLSIAQGILVGILGAIFGAESALTGLVSAVTSIVIFVIYIWAYSRFFIPDVVLALENQLDGTKAISRSWELTQGHVLRLQGVVLVAGLITFPLIALAVIPMILAIASLAAVAVTGGGPDAGTLGFFLISLLVSIVLIIFASIVTAPFWQAIKAAVYYDLRGRREGMGFKLRDRGTL